MVKNHNIFEDLSKLASDAAEAAQGLKKDAGTMVRSQLEKMVQELDVATKEELDVVKEMAAKVLNDNQTLQERLNRLEQRMEELEKR